MAYSSKLFATDQHASVLRIIQASIAGFSYGPFGCAAGAAGVQPTMRFNGQYREPLHGHYLLGNGYRLFNPVLMRFHSPDSMSPFGKGGINAYAYCHADPINGADPSGHVTALRVILKKAFKLKTPQQSWMFRAPPIGGRTAPLLADGTGWFGDHMINEANRVAGAHAFPLASVRTVVAGVDAAPVDFANRLLIAKKTPFEELTWMADYGTAYERNQSVLLLDEITGSSYQEFTRGAKHELLQSVQNRLAEVDYPDAWFSAAQVRGG